MNRLLRALLTMAIGVIALCITASASDTERAINTIIEGGNESSFPLTIEYDFEAAKEGVIYTRDGEFHWAAGSDLGTFQGVTLYDTFIPDGSTGEVSPSLGVVITVTVTTTTDKSGTVTTTVLTTISNP